MRNIFFITSLISAIFMGLTSCHKIEERADDPRGNFEALWSILDEHYCFFKEKGVDWDQVHDKYARRIGSEMTREELFIVCADMLDELRDGHVNLSAPFNNFLAAARGLIIDIRDNGGGSLTNVETLVARFIDRPTLVGYISHKTGPGHDDFSEPYAITYNPAGPGRVRWAKPVVVLTNRSTFSAANNFASVMKLLPGVRIAGATTGGGSGMPYSSEIPCGWSVRFSACSMLDANGVSTEGGVTPTEGCAVDMDPQDALNGKDTMLEKAMELLNN